MQLHLVNYDCLREQIKQIDKNYPCFVPICLVILITALGTLRHQKYNFPLLQVQKYIEPFQEPIYI